LRLQFHLTCHGSGGVCYTIRGSGAVVVIGDNDFGGEVGLRFGECGGELNREVAGERLGDVEPNIGDELNFRDAVGEAGSGSRFDFQKREDNARMSELGLESEDNR